MQDIDVIRGQKIEINELFKEALNLLENSEKNLFITGKAGTGKSTLLEYFRYNTGKKVAVLAPTGVAALNVQGQTIHSFFRFPPHVTVQNVLEKKISKKQQQLISRLDAIVIDEASMLRADLLDCIDRSLRFYRMDQRPFGGLQMVFIGDLYQLPPVVAGAEQKELFRTYYKSPYFFDAKVFDSFEVEFLELEKIYRQRDHKFIGLLNKIRDKTVRDQDLRYLNQRLQPDFESEEEFSITLTPTNAAAAEINEVQLAKLNTKEWDFAGEINGDFDYKHLPTSINLEARVGAQVMLLNNDPGGRWVNGSVGKVVDIGFDAFEGEDVVEVELSEGSVVKVVPYTWEVHRYFFNEEKAQLDTESVGSFTQYPLRLAWAVTIHKSQGKTFDNVIIDIGRGAFAHGQVYVALSRCTNFEGLVLRKPILKRHIIMDYRIDRFVKDYQRRRAGDFVDF